METAAVALVPLALGHADAMYRWMLDPEVASNVGLRAAPSRERTLAFIERASSDDTICARAIVENGTHVGNVVLDRIDRYLGTTRLHIYVGEAAARGRRVGRTALILALDLAFGELGLHKVWLTVHVKNARAIAAYKAVGFVVEGTHREEFLLDGKRVDEVYMGVLASEHRAPRA
jgi:RimJ/RimL family protein N-acetyltransferase